MHLEVTEELRVRTLQAVFDIAAVRGGVRKLCREYGIAKLTYYYWKKRYELSEKSGLYRHKPIPYSSPRKTRPEVAEKVDIGLPKWELEAILLFMRICSLERWRKK